MSSKPMELFNLLMADLEEYMSKGRWGGVRLMEEKVYTLAYAGDLVLLAEEEEGMRSIMARLEGYIRGKDKRRTVKNFKV